MVVWGVKVSTDWQVGLFYSLYFVYEAIGVEFHSWRIFGSALTKSPGTILVISRRISCKEGHLYYASAAEQNIASLDILQCQFDFSTTRTYDLHS